MLPEFQRLGFLRPRELLCELSVLQDASRAGGLSSTPTLETVLDSRTYIALLADLQRRGLVRPVRGDDGLERYSVTPTGRTRLHCLFVDYMRELIRLHDSGLEMLRRSLAVLCFQQVRRVAFYPFAETAEIVYLALESLDLHLVGIVDDAPERWNVRFHGLPIHPPHHLHELKPDAVVVTSCVFEERIVQNLRAMRLDGVKIHTL